MVSILNNCSSLAYQVSQAAEVAGYLWRKGWAKRNGGNIALNINELVDGDIKSMFPLTELISIGTTLPCLKGCYFYCKGTLKRMCDAERFYNQNT